MTILGEQVKEGQMIILVIVLCAMSKKGHVIVLAIVHQKRSHDSIGNQKRSRDCISNIATMVSKKNHMIELVM